MWIIPSGKRLQNDGKSARNQAQQLKSRRSFWALNVKHRGVFLSPRLRKGECNPPWSMASLVKGAQNIPKQNKLMLGTIKKLGTREAEFHFLADGRDRDSRKLMECLKDVPARAANLGWATPRPWALAKCGKYLELMCPGKLSWCGCRSAPRATCQDREDEDSIVLSLDEWVNPRTKSPFSIANCKRLPEGIQPLAVEKANSTHDSEHQSQPKNGLAMDSARWKLGCYYPPRSFAHPHAVSSIVWRLRHSLGGWKLEITPVVWLISHRFSWLKGLIGYEWDILMGYSINIRWLFHEHTVQFPVNISISPYSTTILMVNSWTGISVYKFPWISPLNHIKPY